MAIQKYPFRPKGTLHAAIYGTTGPFRRIGNCSKAEFKVSTESDDLNDFENPGGGLYNSIPNIKDVTLDLVNHDVANPENLALELMGANGVDAADAVTDEEVSGLQGSTLFLSHINASAVTVSAKLAVGAATWAATTAKAAGAVVVPTVANTYWYQASASTGSTGGTEPTWPTTVGATVTDGAVTWRNMGLITLVENTDYTLDFAGPVLADAARIYTGADNTSAMDFLVDYDYPEQQRIEGMINSGVELTIRFVGYNEALSDAPFLVHGWRVKSAPVDAMPLVAEKHAGPASSYKVLKDTTRTGVGLSKYCTWIQ